MREPSLQAVCSKTGYWSEEFCHCTYSTVGANGTCFSDTSARLYQHVVGVGNGALMLVLQITYEDGHKRDKAKTYDVECQAGHMLGKRTTPSSPNSVRPSESQRPW